MTGKPAKPSFGTIYRQQYVKDQEAERSSRAYQILRFASPVICLVVAISVARHWIAFGISLVVFAVCIVGIVGLGVWSRRHRESSSSGNADTQS